jgi:thiamine-phosphate pyrophosphorylase
MKRRDWRANAMLLDPQKRFPVMCLTQDGTGIPHSEQAVRLCSAGARWIQLRMKDASPDYWMAEAIAAVDACRRHDAILIVNDSVEIATASGADGVHLGGGGGDWAAARLALGPDGILGGTINSVEEAARAVESGCLDYAGVGPLRFTSTKRALAPLLGLEGVRRIVAELRGIPAWVIGGVTPSDLHSLRELGAAGVAVSSSIHLDGRLEENLGEFLAAWEKAQAQPATLSPS